MKRFLLTIIILLPLAAVADRHSEREYGIATTIDVCLADYDDTRDFETTATFAAGDVTVMQDEGAEANITTLPTDEGNCYSVSLSATEMQAARIAVILIDQTPTKVWMDDAIYIETYDNVSAQHTEKNVNVIQVSGDATAADDLEALLDGTGGVTLSGDLAGSINSVGTGGITAGSIATDAIGASEIAASAIGASEIATAAINSDELNVDGAEFTLIPYNAAGWDVDIESEVNDALVAIFLDSLFAVNYDPASKPGVATALLNELVEDDGGVSRYTVNALEQAPTGGSAPTVVQIRQEMDSNSTQLSDIVSDTNELQTDDTPGAIAALNDFNPASDAVANVTLVATTTTNTDMRGTDGANTQIPLTAVQIESEVNDGLINFSISEPAGVFSWPASLADLLGWQGVLGRNEIQQTSTTKSIRNDADSANIATCAVSDNGTTFQRDECL